MPKAYTHIFERERTRVRSMTFFLSLADTFFLTPRPNFLPPPNPCQYTTHPNPTHTFLEVKDELRGRKKKQ